MVLATRPRSVTQGGDQECLVTLLDLHALPLPEILDVTWGRGSIWRGLGERYQPLRNDLNPKIVCDWHYDFRALPEDWTSSFDVLVFDPPGISEAGRNSRYYNTMGVDHPDLQHSPDNTHLFAPFLHQAARVLRPKGVVLAKIGDQVHRGIYRHQMVDFVNAVRSQPGLRACDVLVKNEPRASSMMGHNWQRVKHLRKAHVFWLVLKKGRC